MSDDELYERVVDALAGASEVQLAFACALADRMNREQGIQRRISAQRRQDRMAGRAAAPLTRAMSRFRMQHLSVYGETCTYGKSPWRWRPWRWVDDAFSGIVHVDRSLLLAPLVEAGILVEEDLVEAGIIAEEDLA